MSGSPRLSEGSQTMKKSSEKSNAVPDDDAVPNRGRWTPEQARENGRRGGIARWAAKTDEDELDERLPAATSAA